MRRALQTFLGALAALVAVRAFVREDLRVPTPPDAGIDGPVTRAVVRPGFVSAPRASDLPKAVRGDGMAKVKDLVGALLARMKQHKLTLLGAGLAYYAFFTLFPLSIAAASIYGLVADPAQLQRIVDQLDDVLPEATAEFLEAQFDSIFAASRGGLGIATGISIVVALWSASAGAKALITGVNAAYEQEETRPFLVLRGVALATTVGVVLFGLTSAAAATALPRLLGAVGLRDETVTLVSILRWPVIIVVVFLGLGALYKFAPNRPSDRTPWVNVGAGFAAAAWVLATLAFSLYVQNPTIGNFGEVYGALAGLAALMLWFFISGVIILIGAELNHELERRRVYA